MFDVDTLLSSNIKENDCFVDNNNDFILDKLDNLSLDINRWKNSFLTHLHNKEISSKTIRSYLFTINNLISFSEKYPFDNEPLLSEISHKNINDYLVYLENFKIYSSYGNVRERLLILSDYLEYKKDENDELLNRHNFIEERLKYCVDSIDYVFDLWDDFFNFSNLKENQKLNDDIFISFINFMKESDKRNTASIKTMQLRKSTIQSFFSFISEFNESKIDFKTFYPLIKNYKSPKNNHISLVRGLTEDDEEKILSFLKIYTKENINNHSKIKNILLIQLMLKGGLRVSEVVNLKYLDVQQKSIIKDNKESKVYIMNFIGKGNKKRIVPIKAEYIDFTFSLCLDNKKGDYLSSKSDGNKMSEEGIKVFFRNIQILAKLSKQYSVHQLRHSFAENFVVQNGNIRLLQEMLGHSDIKTSMIYGQVKETDLIRNVI